MADLAARGESGRAAVVGRLLATAGASLALAESCTGGRMAAALTAIPGASQWLWGSVVAYTAAAKQALLGLDPLLLERHGTVSAATTEALARAVLQRAGTTWGLAVTGWAGPDGGTPSDPVGTVYVAVAGADGVSVRRFLLGGDRQAVLAAAVEAALGLLQASLEGQRPPPGAAVGGGGA